MGQCKDCEFWNAGRCDTVGMPDSGFGWEQDPRILFDIGVDVDDDSGLQTWLRTGPEFGCVRFQARVSAPVTSGILYRP